MPTGIHWPLSTPAGAPSPSSPAVSFSQPAYVRMLAQLLPPGKAFEAAFIDGTDQRKVLQAIADELARVDARGVDLLNEGDPRTANETITDWERVLGLPDTRVTVIPATLPLRQVAVTQKYVDRGGQNVAFFVALAAACGYTLVDKTLATPVISSVVQTSSIGGSLTPGAKYYRVSAVNLYGETIASAEMSVVVSAGTSTNQVQVTWGAVDGATSYRIFGRSTGAELAIGGVTGATTFVDTGATAPGGALPAGPNPLAYKAIERFANRLLRVGFRVNDRCYAEAYAYAMLINAQTPVGTALAQADFERVIRHVTHSHIDVIFVYH